jgi:hypothetical protein
MKKELALQLIQSTLPSFTDESEATLLFQELQFLADYKYNQYEMYHPGRLFLENLYVWLLQFKLEERTDALEFLRKKLIFISRQEFQQLADIVYHDIIKRQQIKVTAGLSGFPLYKVRAIHESNIFKKVARASLYVGMSDGARIDYIRRHNLDINNEQVLPYYAVSGEKIQELKRDLQTSLNDSEALFRCLFLVDDFCGSGRTLAREVVKVNINQPYQHPIIPLFWQSRLRFTPEKNELELLYNGVLSPQEKEVLLTFGSGSGYHEAINCLIDKCKTRDTTLKGALQKAFDSLNELLDYNVSVYFCPLLATQHALNRLEPLVSRLSGSFAKMQILPGAVLNESEEIKSTDSQIGSLCENYYSIKYEDEHTGCVKFGFDNCGLPLVLHHNTPNNSIFLLWARKRPEFNPLFIRYERHGREGI